VTSERLAEARRMDPEEVGASLVAAYDRTFRMDRTPAG
jgi:hypothetical protein